MRWWWIRSTEAMDVERDDLERRPSASNGAAEQRLRVEDGFVVLRASGTSLFLLAPGAVILLASITLSS